MDAWDYRIRKVEIAWELAQMRLKDMSFKDKATDDWEETIESTLSTSWRSVEKIFPALRVENHLEKQDLTGV